MFGKGGCIDLDSAACGSMTGNCASSTPPSKTDIDIGVDSIAQGKGDAAPPIVARRRRPLARQQVHTSQARAESPLALRDKHRPYRIDARAQAGATRAHARGTLLDPLRMRDFDVQLALVRAGHGRPVSR